MNSTIKLIGAPQSPYSRKMRAALRYRQIPFSWVRMGSPESQGAPNVKIPGMIPVLWFSHDKPELDSSMQDSTFQLKRLEDVDGRRSLYPEDPVVSFIAALLEDFADEWLTKCMFHFRWHGKEDIDKAGTILPLELQWSQSDENIQVLKEQFAQRQIERLWVVGSNENTRQTIEQSYIETLQAMNHILTQQPFLSGARPSAADFAFYGQLVCLTQFDPTPERICMQTAPRVYAWVECMEDISGEDTDRRVFISRDDIARRLGPLLELVGRYYVPFLLANADALDQGDDKVRCEINGCHWEQKPFPYQRKCLVWLREAFFALNDHDQAFTKAILQEKGCLPLIEG